MSLFGKKEENKEAQNFGAEFVNIGHLIKYNFYLLAKAIVFHAVVPKTKTVEQAAEKTNQIISELDLDTKARLEAIKQSQEKKA